MMDYTPGPWRWEITDDCILLLSSVKSEIGYSIIMGEYFGTGHNETFMPDGKDADLIAVTPEMYEIIDTLENDNGSIPDWLWQKILDVKKRMGGEC
jgi:hypothetical protein